MRDETQDLRVKKTKNAIMNSFQQMILEMDLNEISVKELCARAQISRKTFYIHYTDIEDLIMAFQRQLFEEQLREIGTPYMLKDGPSFFRASVIYFAKNADLWCKLYSSHAYMEIFDSYILNAKEKLGFELFVPGTKHPELAAAFMSNALHAVVYEWYRGGRKQSIEELADYATTLVYSGVQ